jgi:chromosome segregation ATPase
VSINELTVQISTIVSENEGLKTKLDDKDRELSSFEIQIINWELELTNCQGEIDQKNNLLVQLEESQQDGNALNDALKQLNITIEVNEEKNTQLQVQNNELRLMIEGLNADIEKLSVLPSIIMNLEHEIDSLQSTNAQLRLDYESLTVNFTNLQIDCQRDGDDQKDLVEKLSFDLQTAIEANNSLSAQISELTIVIRSLEGNQQTIDELNMIVNELGAQLESSKDDNNQLVDEINRLNSLMVELDSLKEQNSMLSIEINNLSIHITEVNQSISICQQDNQVLKRINQKIGNDIKILTGELDLKQFANDGTALLIGQDVVEDY